MRIDLSIVPVLDTESKVDPSTFENILIDSKIPCRHLETMEDISRNLIFWYTFMHNILEVPHLPYTFTVLLHKSFLEQHLLIEEMFLSCDFLEALRDLVVAITDEADEEVVFAEIVFFI